MESMNIRGDKRDALIAAGKASHRILLFGKKLFGEFAHDLAAHDNALIETLPYPDNYSDLGRLSNYSLVIADYAAFFIGGTYDVHKQDIFEKQMIEALDSGTTFCFVHYDEVVPEYDGSPHAHGDMSLSDISRLQQFQIGFKWLSRSFIRPLRNEHTLFTGKLHRGEFKPFIDKWGASRNTFITFDNGRFDDIIYAYEEEDTDELEALGFTIKVRKGQLIYLPFQRDLSRKQQVTEGLHTLIDNLLTYIAKTQVEQPEWGKEPFFEEETAIKTECDELEKRLAKARSRLKPFDDAKALLFQSEYILENTVPQFITSHLGIDTDRNEKYKEDFWIVNDKGEKLVISEVKSMIKGFKKSAIFSLFNHREENNLEESFPALLIANCNLQAGSWREKDRGIDKQDYQVAAQNNILVLRIEDLVRLWETVRKEQLKPSDVLDLFLSKRGWLRVNPNLEIREMK